MALSSITSPLTTTTTTTTDTIEEGGATTLSAMHQDNLEFHILTRLDGPTLASASCCSSTLRSLSGQSHLWSHVCHSTWPSTSTPMVSQFMHGFPNGGPRSFFAHSFPLALPEPTTSTSSNINRSSSPPAFPSELMSAVDIHYRNELIFTKVQETETVTGWFLCSPFRIDLLDPKDVVPTSIKLPEGDDTSTALMEDMKLSWILIDPDGRRAVNLSSSKPVSVKRHWLSGEVQARFASILAGDEKRSAAKLMQCEIAVTCGGSEGGEMQVREVSMQVEDMDGTHLNGRDSLVILHRALEGKRGNGWNREEEGRRRYRAYLEMKRERRERKLRREGALDAMCVAFGVTIFTSFWLFVLCR